MTTPWLHTKTASRSIICPDSPISIRLDKVISFADHKGAGVMVMLEDGYNPIVLAMGYEEFQKLILEAKA